MGNTNLAERCRTFAERRYRDTVSNCKKTIVACWDLDGVLADERSLLPHAREILEGFDREKWVHVITTASPSEHAYPLIRDIDDIISGVFTETASGYGKDYRAVREQFPGSDILVVGDNAYDVPSDGLDYMFIYGTNLHSIASMARNLAFIGAGNIHIGFDELKAASKKGFENSPLYIPAIFGEVKGVKTVIVE